MRVAAEKVADAAAAAAVAQDVLQKATEVARQAAQEAARQVAATAQNDQPTVALAHDITDERQRETTDGNNFAGGLPASRVTSLPHYSHSPKAAMMRC